MPDSRGPAGIIRTIVEFRIRNEQRRSGKLRTPPKRVSTNAAAIPTQFLLEVLISSGVASRDQHVLPYVSCFTTYSCQRLSGELSVNGLLNYYDRAA